MDEVDSVAKCCAQNPIEPITKPSNRRDKIQLLVCLFLFGVAWYTCSHISSEDGIAD